ncbi:MAG: hypothetical protein U5K37_10630 [Natrialbaceae archaeon]|nr:hypothetical protein [Natrialbaceae archaeon]
MPERILGLRDGAVLARLLEGSASAGAFTTRDIERYRASWQAGSIRGMLNWYRAAGSTAGPAPLADRGATYPDLLGRA